MLRFTAGAGRNSNSYSINEAAPPPGGKLSSFSRLLRLACSACIGLETLEIRGDEVPLECANGPPLVGQCQHQNDLFSSWNGQRQKY
jgi:hypothetical protein